MECGQTHTFEFGSACTSLLFLQLSPFNSLSASLSLSPSVSLSNGSASKPLSYLTLCVPPPPTLKGGKVSNETYHRLSPREGQQTDSGVCLPVKPVFFPPSPIPRHYLPITGAFLLYSCLSTVRLNKMALADPGERHTHSITGHYAGNTGV